MLGVFVALHAIAQDPTPGRTAIGQLQYESEAAELLDAKAIFVGYSAIYENIHCAITHPELLFGSQRVGRMRQCVVAIWAQVCPGDSRSDLPVHKTVSSVGKVYSAHNPALHLSGRRAAVI